jgi:DNA-binding NtrC family response regulator
MKPRILIVDDDPGTLESLSRAFALEGYEVATAGSARAALARLDEGAVDAVLSDVVMPDLDGLALLEEVRSRGHRLPVLMMSGEATIEAAVRATRLGALDFVEKPVSLERLLLSLRNALRLDRLERENRELQRYWRHELALVGEGAAMSALRRLIEKAAPSDVPILILGENGTGKELAARAVHDLSPRSAAPFVKLNCAAIPAELVESELFGHEKGAFSGAVARRRGRFEEADGGTLFLDEIGDMPRPMQAKLLRVVQDGALTRVGGSGEIRVDVRLISATNQDLDELIREGSFREDLHYRINTVSLRTPSLGERPEDVPALVEHFTRAACERNHWKPRAFSPDAVERLRRQPWKGNVRELRNAVERALILCETEPISSEELAGVLPAASPRPGQVPLEGSLREISEAYERDVIRARLRSLGGHVTNAARSLGLERSHLYKKCRQLGVELARGSES